MTKEHFFNGLTIIFIIFIIFFLNNANASSRIFYVDYTGGNDSSNGTSKLTAWQHAPGMNGATGVPASIVLQHGDSVILKGCVTWPNSVFTWYLNQSGVAPNSIYYGVDKTW